MIYTVLVKPGNKKGPLVEVTNNESLMQAESNTHHFTVYLQAKAVDGNANKQLIEVLSKYFKTSKSKITIIRGEKSRIKHIEVSI